MAKKYDVVMKELVERDPAAWLKFLEIDAPGPIQIINTDLSTILLEADKILLIDSGRPHLVHLEFQSGRDHTLPRRLHQYNCEIDMAHDKPVRSIAILLNPKADHKDLTGTYNRDISKTERVLSFNYRVVRPWLLPVDPLLTGDRWLIPLAPLSNIPYEKVIEVIHDVDSRLSREPDRSTAGTIMEMTLILAGLRLGNDSIRKLRETLNTMTDLKESSYYKVAHADGRKEGRREGRKEGLEKGLKQGLEKGREEGREEGREQGREEGREKGLKQGIEEGLEKGLEKGKIAEARRILLRLAEVRFGPAGKSIRATIEAIDELDRLEKMTDRILTAKNWRELIDQSASDRN